MNLQVPRILWASMLFSNVVLLGIGLFVLPQPPVEHLNLEHLGPTTVDLQAIVWGMSFLAVASSFVVPKVLVKPFAAPENANILPKAFTPFILTLALSEASTFAGFVAADTLVAPPTPELMILPALAGMAGIALRFPTVASLRALAGAQ